MWSWWRICPRFTGVILKHVFAPRSSMMRTNFFPEQIRFNREERFFLGMGIFLLASNRLIFTTSLHGRIPGDIIRAAQGIGEGFSNAPAFDPVQSSPKAPPARYGRRLRLAAKPVLLFHGGLGFNRNIELLIEAVSEMTELCASGVHSGFRNYELHQSQAGKLNTANIHFIPAVPQSELAPWVQDADAVFNPLSCD